MSDSLLTEIPNLIDVKDAEALIGVIDNVFHEKLTTRYDSPKLHWSLFLGANTYLKTDEEIADEVKAKLKRCTRILLAQGFEISKHAGEHAYTVIGKRNNIEIRFSVPTSYTCKMVPVTDDNGEQVMETRKVTKVVEEEVTEPKMEKQCAPIFSAREWDDFS